MNWKTHTLTADQHTVPTSLSLSLSLHNLPVSIVVYSLITHYFMVEKPALTECYVNLTAWR